MYDSFLEFINEYQLVQPSDRVLLAVSGGIDSVVMVDLFARAAFPVGIAHVNFGLRGAEADADQAFVAQLAERLQIPFHTIRYDTEAIAAERGLSVQLAARALRYDWFRRVADEQGYTRIATAHHQNDVLETLLLNLVRGTGLSGLRGIPIQQGDIIRPLWFASRADVDAYARTRGLLWREDASNQTDKYARNRLRHQVVPVLTALNPDLLRTLPRTVERLRAAETLLTESLANTKRDCFQTDGTFTRIDVAQLTTLPEWRFQLSEWLKPYGFSYVQSLGVGRAVVGEKVGQVFRSALYSLWHDRSGLILAPLRVDEPFSYTLPEGFTGEIELPDGRRVSFTRMDRPTDLVIPTDPTVAYVDADELPESLSIRCWQAGDRFQPLNMRGHKQVSDLLNDRKVSLPERSRTAVLTAGEQIIWVVGHRLAHMARITATTRRILVVQLLT